MKRKTLVLRKDEQGKLLSFCLPNNPPENMAEIEVESPVMEIYSGNEMTHAKDVDDESIKPV